MWNKQQQDVAKGVIMALEEVIDTVTDNPNFETVDDVLMYVKATLAGMEVLLLEEQQKEK